MREILVDLAPSRAARTRIVVGPGAVARLRDLAHSAASVHVVADPAVTLSPWWQAVLAALPVAPSSTALVEGVEASKSVATVARLWDEWGAARAGRDALVVAVGGGVVTDVAGFAAATHLRGVAWMAVPTTVLGMSDAAIGGKTGVNTRLGKNQAGAVHHPLAVLADLDSLASLPDRDYTQGWAEAIKTGVIADETLLAELEARAGEVRSRTTPALEDLLGRCAAAKAGVVSGDPVEASVREILNFGHTLGHAVEHAAAGGLAHGEAVAIGMVAEARLAERLGRLMPGSAERIALACERLGIPLALPPGLSREALLAALSVDKKRRGGNLRVALPEAMGRHAPAPSVVVGAEELVGYLDLPIS